MSETSDAATPWERRPAESAAAWRAFALYRDLGPDRSLDAVSRTLSGQQGGGKRAAGRINKWSRDYDWVGRAAAYDAHLDSVRLQEAERTERNQAARWARRRDSQLEVEYRISRRLLREAERIARGQGVPAPDGGPPAPLPATATDLRRAASVAATASALARKAIETATGVSMEPPHPSPGGDNPTPAPLLVSVEPLGEADVVRQAREELMQWQKGLGDQLAQSAGPRLAPPGSMPPVGNGL